MKYRKKPVIMEATQWFKNGDHPSDGDAVFETGVFKGERLEGKIVRYFRHPNIPGTDYCAYCKRMFHDHGWIDTVQGGHTVCPGDWIINEMIQGPKGEYYPCKPDIFAMTYEKEEPK